MTLEEAIKILSELHDQCCQADSIFCTDTTGARCEAVDMAISVLQAQDVTDTNVGKIDRYGYIGIETLLNFCENSKDHAVTPNDFMRMKRVRMPEPCEDAVSREFMYELGATCIARPDGNGNLIALGRIDMLPPVTPKHTEIVRCKDCKYYIPYDWMFDGLTRSSNRFDYSPDEIGCSVNEHDYHPEGFCSYAEKREDEWR